MPNGKPRFPPSPVLCQRRLSRKSSSMGSNESIPHNVTGDHWGLLHLYGLPSHTALPHDPSYRCPQPLSPILSCLGFQAFLWLVTGRWDSREHHHGVYRVLWTWWGAPGEGIGCPLQYSWAFLMAQLVNNPPAMWETWIRSLGWEDPLEKGMATHSSVLAWRIPRTEEPGGL